MNPNSETFDHVTVPASIASGRHRFVAPSDALASDLITSAEFEILSEP